VVTDTYYAVLAPVVETREKLFTLTEYQILMTQSNPTHITVLSIDPSIRNLGWALTRLTENKTQLMASGVCKVPPAGTLPQRIAAMTDELALNVASVAHLFKDTGIDFIVVEEPHQWGAARSFAAEQSNEIHKLYFVAGAILESLRFLVGMRTDRLIFLKAIEHKGNLPKNITTQRMEKLYDKSFSGPDEADAVWIGWSFLVGPAKNKRPL